MYFFGKRFLPGLLVFLAVALIAPELYAAEKNEQAPGAAPVSAPAAKKKKPAAEKNNAAEAQKKNNDVLSPIEAGPVEDLKSKEDLAQKALKQAANKKNKNNEVLEEDELVSAPEEGEEIDISNAVLKSLAINPRIASSQAALEGADAGRKAAIANFFPTVNGTYTATWYDHKKPYVDAPRASQTDSSVYYGALSVIQPVFTGFKLINTYLKTKMNKEKAEADKATSELSLILTVQQNFLTLLKARDLVRSDKDSVTRLRSQLKVTQAFYDVGLKPRFDVLQAEVNLSKAEDQLLQDKNTVETQKARLNTLLMLPIDKKVNYIGQLTYTPFSMKLEDCVLDALAQRPDLKATRKAVEMAEKDVGIAQSGFYPQINANITSSRDGNHPWINGSDYGSARTEFAEWSAGVSATWKIFDFGSTYYTMRQAQAGVRQYLAEEEKAREEVLYEVKTRHLTINETAKRIKVAKKGVEQAKEGYRMAVARYQAQVGTNTDVLDAQASLTSAEAALTTALADYQTALAQMYASMGQKNYSLISN
jgi:outer membrane protein